MSNIFAISTSSSLLSAAVKKSSGEILELAASGSLNHAEKLMPFVDRLLQKARLKVSSVDTYLIDRGPGSFTGLRVGFATLAGLLALEKKDCYGCLSLDIMAQRCLPGEKMAVLLDAYRQKIYARTYRNSAGRVRAETGVQVLPLAQVVSLLTPETVIAGNAVSRYREKLLETVPPERFASERKWYPRASNMIEAFLAERDSSKKDRWFQKLVKTMDFLPLYFRLSEAEEKRDEHANLR
ncbi:MAG: tRNA (adenosine(37)-N6)-threonylcarbamoyltransferase complex dimerization subunit type 1 TsaB [Candidatus Omnitrophota bacterium]